MPTRQQVRALLGQGLDHREVGRRLGIAPGLVYLIATGLPADGGDAPTPEERQARELIRASQDLTNPPVVHPEARAVVRRWLEGRVRADAQMRNG
ncbi:hypothetical protein [Saccharomonospora saliphila]|uniref:hypothetical protein n=1 Tax=Saccharomonospora saliphila TaxID=369829 RepID=UPI00035F0A1F|nr:hypothetical protein [Saccharomonospora saliphila]